MYFSKNGGLRGFSCTLWLVIDYVAGSASVLCIVVISLDRYMLVSRGLDYIAKQKVNHAILIIITVWVIAFLNYAPAILLADTFKPLTQVVSSECKVWFDLNLTYLIITACVEFFLPLIIISSLNLAVYCNIKKRSQSIIRGTKSNTKHIIANRNRSFSSSKRSDIQEPNFKSPTLPKLTFRLVTEATIEVARLEKKIGNIEEVEEGKSEKNVNNKLVSLTSELDNLFEAKSNKKKFRLNSSFASKLISLRKRNKLVKDKKSAHFLFILVFSFFFCWAPYTLLTLIKPVCNNCINEMFYELTFWLLWFNSTLNPIIYPFLHVNFRTAFLKIFHDLLKCCKLRKRGRSRHHSSFLHT